MTGHYSARPLILGYGNSLRGDDAVGPRLATILGGVAVQQLVPELAERLAAEERVIFVDARADLAPGDVQLMPVDGESASTHWCSPGSLLRLALEVYGKAPRGRPNRHRRRVLRPGRPAFTRRAGRHGESPGADSGDRVASGAGDAAE